MEGFTRFSCRRAAILTLAESNPPLLHCPRMNRLYFGDNLYVLRDQAAFPNESVDLIYLDPPFNSKRDYNLLFKSPKGQESEAQITAFEDSWHWGEQAEREFDEIVHGKNTEVAEMMLALRKFLGENDMMAYLTMMANRLLELHRVLKPTGSLYLHCDPTASHYLKVVLDGVFGKIKFQKRNHLEAIQPTQSNSKFYGAVHDLNFLLHQERGIHFPNKQYEPHDEAYIEERFRFSDTDGRKWAEQNLGNPAYRPNLIYAFKAKNGITYEPPKNGWKYTRERMQQLDKENRLHYPIKGRRPLAFEKLSRRVGGRATSGCLDRFVFDWCGSSPERLGYPTQKP